MQIAIASAFDQHKKDENISPKTRKTSDKDATNVDIGELVSNVRSALQHLLISVVSAAVKVSS